MTRLTKWLAVCLAFSAIGACPAQQHQGLLDAKTAIAKIEAHDPETSIEDSEKAFEDHMLSFAAREQTMPPKHAADEWLALLAQAIAIPHRSIGGGLGGAAPGPVGTLYTAMDDLPGPESWPYIKASVDKLPESQDKIALQILCARLLGDNQALVDLCDQYDQGAGKKPSYSGFLPVRPSATSRIKADALGRLGRYTDPFVFENAHRGNVSENTFPSLLDVFPPDKARKVMLDYLKKTGAASFTDPANVKLAEEVVLAHPNDFSQPDWNLARDESDLPYIQALVDHYGIDALIKTNQNVGDAELIYFRYLICAGKIDQAAEVLTAANGALAMDPAGWNSCRQGLGKQIELLQARLPDKDLSGLYVSAAIGSGQATDAERSLRERLADLRVSEEDRLGALKDLVDLHKRTGDLKDLVQDEKQARSLDSKPSDFDPSDDLLDVGLVTGDEDLVKPSLESAMGWRYRASGLLAYVASHGKLAAWEKACLDHFKKNASNEEYFANAPLDLFPVYYAANRPNDIVDLLENFPWWQQPDLLGYENGLEPSSADPLRQSLVFYAAWALNMDGRRDLAIRLLERRLSKTGNFDLCYLLLNDIAGSTGLSFYDSRLSENPCDELAMLWKADMLFRLGRFDEAEACALRAKDMNPCQSLPYREKLVELLGQIHAKKGEVSAAQQYAKLSEAVGKAEHGEELAQEGLLSLAADELQKAVNACPDDPLLQGQLAFYLGQLCEPEESRRHYLLAFAHIDDALGEDFDGPYYLDLSTRYRPILQPEDLAVFDKNVQQNPSNAEAYFARGLARSLFDLSTKACDDFRKAAALDPRHVRAWLALSANAPEGLVTPEESEEFRLKAFEMQGVPGEFFFQEDYSEISNIARAYLCFVQKLSAEKNENEPVLALHSSEAVGQGLARIWGLRTPGRLLGNSEEFRDIAFLYHLTRFPFE